MEDNKAIKATEAKKASVFETVGVTGLEQYSGYIREEFLTELQGRNWFKIVRQMADNSPTVGAILYVITSMIKQIEWDVLPAENTPEAAEVAEFVKGCFDDMEMPFHDTLGEAISFLEYGWSWMEVTYKRRQGEKRDSLISSEHNDGRVGWAEWGIRGQESLLNWELDERGRVTGMVQQAPPYYKPVIIPLAKSVHFKNGGRKANPEGRSILRNAYRPWYFMENIEQVEGIGIERDLAGLPVVYMPSNSKEDVKDYCRDMVTNIRNDEQAGVVLWSDQYENGDPMFKLELLSTGGSRQFDTNQVINRYERQIATTVVANFLITGMQSHGSFALHSSQTDLFSTSLGGHLKNIAATINRGPIPDVVALNGWDRKLAPTLAHGDIETISLTELSEYIKTLTGTGITFDQKQVNYLLEQAGIPIPEDGIQ